MMVPAAVTLPPPRLSPWGYGSKSNSTCHRNWSQVGSWRLQILWRGVLTSGCGFPQCDPSQSPSRVTGEAVPNEPSQAHTHKLRMQKAWRERSCGPETGDRKAGTLEGQMPLLGGRPPTESQSPHKDLSELRQHGHVSGAGTTLSSLYPFNLGDKNPFKLPFSRDSATPGARVSLTEPEWRPQRVLEGRVPWSHRVTSPPRQAPGPHQAPWAPCSRVVWAEKPWLESQP